MTVVLLINAEAGSGFAHECETLEDAFDVLLTTIKMARRLDRAKYPSVLPRLRDQTLLNFARWLGDGTFDHPGCEELFIQLCARKERSSETADIKRIAAFGVADVMTAALDDPNCWPDFDAKYDEFRRLLISN